MYRNTKRVWSLAVKGAMLVVIQCTFCVQPQQLDSQERVSLESKKMNDIFDAASDHPGVTGKLTGEKGEDWSAITVQCVVTSAYRHSYSKTIAVSEDGSFEIPLHSPIPYQDVYLRIGDSYSTGLVVKEGMHLNLDWKQLKSSPVQFGIGEGVEYTGKDAEMNRILCEYRVSSMDAMQKANDRVFEASWNQKLPPEEITVILKEILEQDRKLQREFLEGKLESAQQFAWMLEEESLNSYYGDLLIAYMGHEIPNSVWQELEAHQPVVLNSSTSSFYHNFVLFLGQPPVSELKEFVRGALDEKISDENREEFEAYVDCFVDARAGREYDKVLFKRGGQKFMVANTESFQEARLAYFAKRVERVSARKRGPLMLLGGDQRGSWKMEEYVAFTLSQMSPGWCKTVMETEFAKDQEKKSKLEEAFSGEEKPLSLGTLMHSTEDGAKLYYADQDSPAELAAAIRKSFPDKAIILDMWATSCGSCIEDMKHSKPTKDKLAELPVVIVYLCFSSEYETWMETTSQMGVPGYHVFLNEKLSADAMEFFEFTAFPNFLFIGLDGKIDSELVSVLSSVDIERVRKKLKMPSGDKGKE